MHPNFPTELPSLCFAEHSIAPYGELSKEVSVFTTIAADGFYEGPTENLVDLIELSKRYETQRCFMWRGRMIAS